MTLSQVTLLFVDKSCGHIVSCTWATRIFPYKQSKARWGGYHDLDGRAKKHM